MTDFVASIFGLKCSRGYFAPHLNLGFKENVSGDEWNVMCGGTRAYVARMAGTLAKDLTEQSADSHFAVRRLTALLLIGGAGLFQVAAAGRLMMWNIDREFPWTVHFDYPDPDAAESSVESIKTMEDWWAAITRHTVLRRALEDVHLALSHPAEALIFVYRGLEWIVKHFGFKWEDLAQELGVPFSEIRALKRLANDETGVRHGSKSGEKLRAMPENYGTWPCALIDAINIARHKLEPNFTVMSPQAVGKIVSKAVSVVPYE